MRARRRRTAEHARRTPAQAATAPQPATRHYRSHRHPHCLHRQRAAPGDASRTRPQHRTARARRRRPHQANPHRQRRLHRLMQAQLWRIRLPLRQARRVRGAGSTPRRLLRLAVRRVRRSTRQRATRGAAPTLRRRQRTRRPEPSAPPARAARPRRTRRRTAAQRAPGRRRQRHSPTSPPLSPLPAPESPQWRSPHAPRRTARGESQRILKEKR